MKFFRDSIKLFRFNMTYTILYEIMLKTASFAILIPLYLMGINIAVKLSGISYLTKETAGKFFKAPSTYAIIFIMLYIMAMSIMIDVSGISYAYSRAHFLKKTSPVRMLLVGIRSALRMLRPANIPIFLFELCYLPVIANIMVDFSLLNIRAPYMIDILSINIKVTVVCVAIYFILMIYSLRYTFLIHVYNVEKISFKKAADHVKVITKGKMPRIFAGIFIWSIIVIGIPAALNYFYTGPVLDRVLTTESALKVATIVYEAIKIVFSAIYVIVGLPIIYAAICNAYYDIVPVDEDVKTIDDYDAYDAKKSSRLERRILVVIICLALIFDAGFYTLKRYDLITLDAAYMDKVTITAHRGASKGAPENTLSAFELAIENNADVIELDVRQTKDGEIVVMHDESLKRTCGVDKKVGKLTYEELLEYSPAAKYKGKNKADFKEEKIPTLRQVLDLVGDRADLNIELKPAKTDKNLEKQVAKLVEEYDLYDRCVVTSQTYKSIKKIKKADSNIKTIYVMSVAMGDFYNLEYADGFSIKYRYINNEIVKQVHMKGKDVYAWTIDDSAVLENMMMLNVDSIITNDPEGMRKAMYENYYGDTLIERIYNILGNQI